MSRKNKPAPFHPIIYVRGYAMTTKEIDDTTADPFCGFNVGSTVFRAVADKKAPPRKFMFESPVLRLASDFEYEDVFENGYDIVDKEWLEDGDNRLSSQSVIVYRYYDESSELLGDKTPPSMERFAKDLGELILQVKALTLSNPENTISEKDFRCYLVAHSMGGLVCRAFLQNPKFDPKKAGKLVDKFFTYATPHNGIDVAGFNVPSWLGLNSINTFSRPEMAKYLNLQQAYKKTDRVDWLPEDRFPSERVFCMVGTNRMDYEAAKGASRTFVGHGSDGLVRIENATLCGLKASGDAGDQCAKAFAFRSHSGYFGIVNSEEAYQNLTRFLFGDVRVDVWVDLESIELPAPVKQAEEAGEKISALYQVETIASVRGKLWYLSRRVAEEDSVACLSYEEWKKAPKKNGSLYLSSVFLANRSRVNMRRKSLAYSLSLGIRVPDYEIDKKLWINEHYEGGYLFRNAIIVELTPPTQDGGNWKVEYAWQGTGSSPANQDIDPKKLAHGKIELPIPFPVDGESKVKGRLRFVVSGWNTEG
jgi:hypothetical protein